jgi:hypothetical protein
VYDPIYSQNIGLCGFRCRVGACTKVVRTYRGINMHCLRVHGLRAQIAFPFPSLLIEEKKDGESQTERELQSVRSTETA